MRNSILYLALASVLCFAAMGLDKARARHHKWRIREATLILLAALGGALGGCMGMVLFHHKTRHPLFQWSFPLLLLAQTAAVYLLWRMKLLT
ncbi:MAG: DUF1294 domain-containing protein [Oscillospiraceae bacterium]|nr:DUF1294 domain-containing protein [Oscillospiraceae bacterium]